MRNTPIERKLIDETIEAFQIADFGKATIREVKADRKSTRLNSSHPPESRMPSSA